MSIKLSQSSPNIPVVEYTADASISYVAGTLGYRDESTGEIKTVDASNGDVLTLECLINETITSAASNPRLECVPIISGMLYEVDCSNNTAADQLNKKHLMTDGGTVANTSTTQTTILAIFVAVSIIGEASDKKLLGYFIKLGQVTVNAG